jgi:hypothetical protein
VRRSAGRRPRNAGHAQQESQLQFDAEDSKQHAGKDRAAVELNETADEQGRNQEAVLSAPDVDDRRRSERFAPAAPAAGSVISAVMLVRSCKGPATDRADCKRSFRIA